MRLPAKKVHRVFVLSLAVYVLALLVFTLYPRPLLETGDSSALSEFLKSHGNLFYKILYADTSIVYIGNYLMLFPLALLLSWSYPKWPVLFRMGVVVGLSGLIELFQLAIPGRVSDLVDFASNSLGAILGVVLFEILQRGRRSRALRE